MTVPPTLPNVPSRFLRPRNRDVELGTSFWIVPAKLTARVLVLAIVTIALDNRLQKQYAKLPRWLKMSPSDTKTILSTLAGGSITVVALVISLTMVVLSLVAANFGPRIILNFVRRRTTQLAIGSFVASFVYSLLTLATVFGGTDAAFAPILSTWTAVVLVLCATGLLVVFVQDVSSSIQIGNMLFEIAAELDAAIRRQRRLSRRAITDSVPSPDSFGWDLVMARMTGYVQHIDFDALVDLAKRHHAVIDLHHRAGSFLNAGRPLARVSVPFNAEALEELHTAVVVGTYRTMEQDLEYAIAEYVEIALRALSPAVNDPATAVSCIDWIGDSLIALSAEPIAVAGFRDDHGQDRVYLPANSLRRVVAAAFDEIRQNATGSPTVAIHMLTTIAKVSPAVHDMAARLELRSQVEAISESATAACTVERDRLAIHEAAAFAMDMVGPAE